MTPPSGKKGARARAAHGSMKGTTWLMNDLYSGSRMDLRTRLTSAWVVKS